MSSPPQPVRLLAHFRGERHECLDAVEAVMRRRGFIVGTRAFAANALVYRLELNLSGRSTFAAALDDVGVRLNADSRIVADAGSSDDEWAITLRVELINDGSTKDEIAKVPG